MLKQFKKFPHAKTQRTQLILLELFPKTFVVGLTLLVSVKPAKLNLCQSVYICG